MKLLIDADLPTALAEELRRTGHDCEHMTELGRGTDPDEVVHALAQAEGRVIVTRDHSFADITRFPLEQHHGVIRVRAHGYRREALVSLVTDFPARNPGLDLAHTIAVVEPESERLRRA